MLKFEANKGGSRLVRSYGQRYHLLYEGKVPEELAPSVRVALDVIKSKKTKNRMSTFYFVVDGETIQGGWISISGVTRSDKSSISLGQKLKSQLPKIEFIPCHPNSRAITEVDEDADDDNNRLDKIMLFIRFLIQLTSNLDKSEYANLIHKFHLTDSETLHVRQLKALWSSEVFKQQFIDFCKERNLAFTDIQEETTDKMRYFSYVLGLHELHLTDPGVSEHIRQSFVDAGLHSLYDPDRERLQQGLTNSHFSSDYGSDLSVFKQANLALWSFFENHENFKLSAVLSHCSETNLLAFLKQNKIPLEMQGQHIIFSIKVSHDDELTISSPCDVCLVHLPNTLETLLSPELAAQSETLGVIPCRIFVPDTSLAATSSTEVHNHECHMQ